TVSDTCADAVPDTEPHAVSNTLADAVTDADAVSNTVTDAVTDTDANTERVDADAGADQRVARRVVQGARQWRDGLRHAQRRHQLLHEHFGQRGARRVQDGFDGTQYRYDTGRRNAVPHRHHEVRQRHAHPHGDCVRRGWELA